jgi:hypothetical protein
VDLFMALVWTSCGRIIVSLIRRLQKFRVILATIPSFKTTPKDWNLTAMQFRVTRIWCELFKRFASYSLSWISHPENEQVARTAETDRQTRCSSPSQSFLHSPCAADSSV